MTATAQVRSNEIQPVGPDALVPGMPSDRWAQLIFAESPSLPVNQSETGHFCVPCDCQIVAVQEYIITQQAGANRTVVINKNGSQIAAKALLTTDATGTRAWTVGSGGDIDTATGKDLLSKGDYLTFSTPNTGASGVSVLSVTLRPR